MPANDGRIEVSRWKVGLVSAGCFVAAGVVWIGWPEREMVFASLIRVGFLMLAIWIAMPSGDRPAAWANISKTTFIGFLAVVVAVVRPGFRPLLIPFLMMLGTMGYFLRPPDKPRPERPKP